MNEPAGSAKNDIPNGGTNAFWAFASMSSARLAFLPPKNIPVRDADLRRSRKDRVLHQARHVVERHVVVGQNSVVTGVDRHVHVERARYALVGVTI